jgi:hypothetical protein
MTKDNKSFGRPSYLRLAAVALLLLTCPSAWAANVVVGNHVVLPNTPNQVITIQVSGGEPIAGEDFAAQIGDGGMFNSGVNTKPVFTNVDILGGTIFAGNNKGATVDAHPLIWAVGTVTANGSVPASGLLATLTIDTSGLSSGTFPLMLTGVGNLLAAGPFNTTLRNAGGNPIPLIVSNGLLTISPYPAADYNHNGLVDAADYTIWRDTLGQAVAIGSGADGDHDGTVTTADYSLWQAEFGYSSPGSGAATNAGVVPEPPTWLVLSVALIFVGCFGILRHCRSNGLV